MSGFLRASVFALLGCAAAIPLGAQVPEQIWVQGLLTDGSGTPLAGPVELEISIFDSETGGTLKAQATFADQVLDEGTYAVALPGGAIVFDRTYWVETKVDGDVLGDRTELGSARFHTPSGFGAFAWNLRPPRIGPRTSSEDTTVTLWQRGHIRP